MKKRVLSVGQCVPDQWAIERFLNRHFDVEVVTAQDARETSQRLAEDRFDLVLVNRNLDLDYSDGIEIIRQLKANSVTSEVPVMLITNFPEHDRAAVKAGAVPGFGKAEVENPATAERLRPYLAADGEEADPLEKPHDDPLSST